MDAVNRLLMVSITIEKLTSLGHGNAAFLHNNELLCLSFRR